MRTLRVVMAGAVTLALLGGSSGIVLAQDVEPMGPFEPDGPSMFTMRQVSIEEVPWPEAEPGPDGSLRGQGQTDAWTVESSDPRLSGRYTLYGNVQAWPLDAEGMAMVTVMSGTVRIENEGGTWTGTRVSYMGTEMADYYHVRGEGGYEGLTALFDWVEVEARGDEAFSVFSGVVIPGALPEYPEPPAE